MTWIGLDDKLGIEVMKSHGLEKELGEVKASLLKESDKHDTLRASVQLVYDDLKQALKQEMCSLMVDVIQIMDRVRDIARDVLHFSIHRSFGIAHSHYENIDLAMISQGFAPGYSKAELKDIKEMMAPLAQDLSIKIKDKVIRRGVSLLDRPGDELVISGQVLNFCYGRTDFWPFSLFCIKKVNTF